MGVLKSDADDAPRILWEDGDRVVLRGWRLNPDGGRSAVLAVRPVSERPSSVTLSRLTHESA